MMNVVDRLTELIGYPEDTAGAFLVDGAVVQATEVKERLRFVRRFQRNLPADATYTVLAGYAAGRMLKEKAVLAWDPEAKELMLWQESSADDSDESLREDFDLFLDSCDWWDERIKELAQTGRRPITETVILP